MAETIQFTIPPDAAPQRADKLLAQCLGEYSRAQLQRALDDGFVSTAAGVILSRKTKLQPGEELVVRMQIPEPDAAYAVEIPLEILFEDEHLIAINKAPGMIIHPGSGTESDTLVHALLYHCGTAGLSRIGAPERPGIVHRLDKETSGVLVVAKTDAAHRSLETQFEQRRTHKEYLCLVAGHPASSSGTIQEPIARHPTIRTRMSIAKPGTGRHAHTDFRVAAYYGGKSRDGGTRAARICCIIHTGRTHQIRVHMKHLGVPILGDTVYGFRQRHLTSAGPKPPRVMLHAEKLALDHPATGEPVTFVAPIPEDFRVVEAALGRIK